jgi:hypothetical protein
MSTITTVVLHTSILEEEDDVKAFLVELFSRDNQAAPLRLADMAEVRSQDPAGPFRKVPGCDVWLGAYNGLDLGMVIQGLSAYKWRCLDDVQLFVNCHEQDRLYLAFGQIQKLDPSYF